jgi:hypothetical protein
MALFYAFSFNVPCQFTLVLNLRPLIFDLTMFGWSVSTYLSLFSYGTIIFYLDPNCYEPSWGVKEGLC